MEFFSFLNPGQPNKSNKLSMLLVISIETLAPPTCSLAGEISSGRRRRRRR